MSDYEFDPTSPTAGRTLLYMYYMRIISHFYVVAKWNICHNALTAKSYCTNCKIILHQSQSAPQARLLLKIKELAILSATLGAL